MIENKLSPFDESRQALEGAPNFRENANYSWSWLIEHTKQQNRLIDELNGYEKSLKQNFDNQILAIENQHNTYKQGLDSNFERYKEEVNNNQQNYQNGLNTSFNEYKTEFQQTHNNKIIELATEVKNNAKVQLLSEFGGDKADLNGNENQKFKVATASNSYEAVNKSQVENMISSLRSSLSSQLSSKANLAGSTSQRFQVATASNSYDAINKSLFDSTISSLRSSLSSQISNNQAISSSSKSKNGYIKFQNGLTIQWGSSGEYTENHSYSPKNISFPLTFQNDCFTVITNVHIPHNGAGGMKYWAVESWSRSSFTIAWWAGRTTWVAIGY